jgi:hypothetical protein
LEIGNQQSPMIWLREKESNLHLRVQSPTCCQLHHPANEVSSFEFRVASEHNSKLETRNSKPGGLVAVAGIEPASLDYQSSALALSYTAFLQIVVPVLPCETPANS